jgi:hypothetical protein
MTSFDTTLIPQPAKRGRGSAKLLKQFAEKLRTMPGEWLPYPFIPSTDSSARAVLCKIRSGSVAFPKGEFEAMRTNADFGPSLLVRYNPGT